MDPRKNRNEILSSKPKEKVAKKQIMLTRDDDWCADPCSFEARVILSDVAKNNAKRKK